MTFTFYATEGTASTGLEVALLAGFIPVVTQLTIFGVDTRDISLQVTFSFLFIIIIILSYIANPSTAIIFVYIANVSFVFFVAMVISNCPDRRVIVCSAANYALIGALFLIYINLTGTFIWGRLFTEGIVPNFWGLIAVSTGISALVLRNRMLATVCWVIALVTLYNTSARGSMVAFFAGSSVIAGFWIKNSRHNKLIVFFSFAAACLAGIVLALGIFPEITVFLLRDVLWVDDPHRGIGTGLTGRVEAWSETLRIWKTAPILGVGYRQHEEMITTSSSAHNAYLTMLVDTGIVGLLIYISFIAMSFRGALRSNATSESRGIILAVITAYVVLGLFERRALNTGNPFSIWFIICSFYVLKRGARVSFKNKLKWRPATR